MSPHDQAKAISALVKRLRAEFGPPTAAASACAALIDPAEPLLAEFVRSLMLWESTTTQADAALRSLNASIVDFNELRICLPDELARMMGGRYPRVEERAARLKAVLNDVYLRQHVVSLEHLHALSKREARDYLESLDGSTPFFAGRVALLHLGGHAAPVDGRILKRLVEAGVVAADATADAASALLERHVRARDLIEAYHLLQIWADAAPPTYSDTPPAHPDIQRALREARGAAQPPAPPAPSGNHAGTRKPVGKAAAKPPTRRSTGAGGEA